jgi:hypothetical protein
MGSSSALLSVQESATRIIQVIDTIPLSCRGQIIKIDGDSQTRYSNYFRSDYPDKIYG